MGIGVISISTSQRREPPTPATVTAANEGLSLAATTVQLGQAVGAIGDPALVTATREIPFDNFANLDIKSSLLPSASLVLSINPFTIDWVFDSTIVQPQFQMRDITSGSTWNLFYDPALNTWFQGGPGQNVTVNGFMIVDISGVNTPSAQLHIGGGGGGAGQGQLKFQGPNLLAVPEPGVAEFNGTNLFFTRVATRENFLIGNAGAAAPALNVAGVPANFYGANGVNYLGDPNNWTQVNIAGVNFKIPLYL